MSKLIVNFVDDLELALAAPGQLLVSIRKLKAFSGLRKSYFSQGVWLMLVQETVSYKRSLMIITRS